VEIKCGRKNQKEKDAAASDFTRPLEGGHTPQNDNREQKRDAGNKK
jgi:hypothetical protein